MIQFPLSRREGNKKTFEKDYTITSSFISLQLEYDWVGTLSFLYTETNTIVDYKTNVLIKSNAEAQGGVGQ